MIGASARSAATMGIGTIVALIDIASSALPERCNTVEVVAKVTGWTVDQVAGIEVIPPGVPIHTRWWLWRRCRLRCLSWHWWLRSRRRFLLWYWRRGWLWL